MSEATAKRNALWTMWKREAQRRAMGDRALVITSAFRSRSCNASVGGASNSRHLYGDAADLEGTPTLCSLAQEARSHGFGGIFGPGYPAHNDHTHIDGRSGQVLVGTVLRRRSRDPARHHPGRPRGDPLTGR